MDLSGFEYHLPEDLIAQSPADQRDHSRLLVVNRDDNTIAPHHFYEIGSFLRPGDVLVMNNTYVFPARLWGTKQGGGAHIEMLLLHPTTDDEWIVIARPAVRLKTGTTVTFSPQLSGEVVEPMEEGRFRVRFTCDGHWDEVIQSVGQIPLPPYIERNTKPGIEDRSRYQTVYAEQQATMNSPAAPTAGLHFTPELLEDVTRQGVEIAPVTLRIGLDTFLPMRVDRVEDHTMHSETYIIPEDSARRINQAKAEGRRIIAVGTTSVRTLESAATNGTVQAGPGVSEIYIYPGYTWKFVDCMITNFHLPRSTLLLLVSAFMGNSLRESAYEFAVQNRFRFYSYGDAMLIL